MIHISLFSGIGGFELAAKEAGWENGASCEINDFGQKVLRYHFPNAYHHDDVKTLTYKILNEELTKRFGANWRAGGIVLSGGFPCQGFSVAGLRAGTDDDRYLWPEYLRLIDEINPDWVCGENVTGILSMEDKSGIYRDVFAKVENRKVTRLYPVDYFEAIYTRQAKMLVNSICEDLEKRGYEVQPFAIPAASVEAPHKRERIWFVANSQRNRGFRDSGGRGDVCNTKWNHPAQEQQRHNFTDGISGIIKERPVTNSNNKGGNTGRGEVQKKDGKIPQRNDHAEFGNSDNGLTTNAGCIIGDRGKGSQRNGIDNRKTSGRNESSDKSELLHTSGIDTDSSNTGVENLQCGGENGILEPELIANANCGIRREIRGHEAHKRGEKTKVTKHSDTGSSTDAADTHKINRMCQSQERGKEAGTRGQSARSDKGVNADTSSPGRQELHVPEFAANSGHGYRNGNAGNGNRGRFDNFPTQSPVCGGNDGIPAELDCITFSKWRNESIKGFGNAVVPAVVVEIFKAIDDYEKSLK